MDTAFFQVSLNEKRSLPGSIHTSIVCRRRLASEMPEIQTYFQAAVWSIGINQGLLPLRYSYHSMFSRRIRQAQEIALQFAPYRPLAMSTSAGLNTPACTLNIDPNAPARRFAQRCRR